MPTMMLMLTMMTMLTIMLMLMLTMMLMLMLTMMLMLMLTMMLMLTKKARDNQHLLCKNCSKQGQGRVANN